MISLRLRESGEATVDLDADYSEANFEVAITWRLVPTPAAGASGPGVTFHTFNVDRDALTTFMAQSRAVQAAGYPTPYLIRELPCGFPLFISATVDGITVTAGASEEDVIACSLLRLSLI